MPYKKTILRKGSLLIEKYSGQIEFDDFIKNGIENFNSTNIPHLILADLSKCSFPNISEQQIQELLNLYSKFPLETNSLKTAIYTGNIEFIDFQKVFKFSEDSSSLPLAVITFSFMDMACDWLGINPTERKIISDFLAD